MAYILLRLKCMQIYILLTDHVPKAVHITWQLKWLPHISPIYTFSDLPFDTFTELTIETGSAFVKSIVYISYENSSQFCKCNSGTTPPCLAFCMLPLVYTLTWGGVWGFRSGAVGCEVNQKEYNSYSFIIIRSSC